MKRAICIAAHGSRHPRAAAAFETFAARTAALYPHDAVRLVFTATSCHGQGHGKTGACGPGEPLEDVLRALREDGVTAVAVLSLHVAPGKEFSSIRKSFERLEKDGAGFARTSVAGPLLAGPERMEEVAAAILAALPAGRALGEAVALMGHGARQPAQGYYDLLEETLRAKDANIFFATLEGREKAPGEMGRAGRGVARIRDELAAGGLKTVWLAPFLTVAGAHAHHDLAGDGAASWKTVLEQSGAVCKPDLAGLLEREPFITLWLRRLDDALAQLDLP